MRATIHDPVRELKAVLAEYLPWHGARIGFLAQFLLALFKVRSVSLAELATGFGGPAKVESHYKRLQRFFRSFEIDQDALARLLVRVLFTLKVLVLGYAFSTTIASLMTSLAISSRLGNDLLETLTAMFNPLPPSALLPLALLWFRLGNGSLLFVLTHSVLWPVAVSTHAGFRAVSPTLRMVGRNYGLRGPRYVLAILIPAAFPSILAGLKNGWAFAWRTLIAAELVFGVSSGSGGLGWYIYENKNQLEIPSVFAGLLTVILIGLAVENLVFRNIERRTVKRWGMHT